MNEKLETLLTNMGEHEWHNLAILNMMIGSKESIKDALAILRIGAKRNSPMCTYMLAECYQDGFGVTRNVSLALKHYEKAFPDLKLLADRRKNPVAMVCMATYYSNGDMGQPLDIPLALKYLELAAEQDHAPAQYMLGTWYLGGDIVEKNIELALFWLRTAANQNEFESILLLGRLYHEGIEVEEDFETAYQWFHKACETENPRAYYSMYRFLKTTPEGRKREKEMLDWLLKGVELKHADCQCALGVEYILGKLVSCNVSKAIEYLKLATKNHSPEAPNHLGELYRGYSNMKQAYHYFKMAVKRGSNQGMYNLATTYLMGYPDYDLFEGMQLMKCAAENKNALASFEIGMAYKHGIVFSKNLDKAIEYLSFAGERGVKLACDELVKIYSKQGPMGKVMANKWKSLAMKAWMDLPYSLVVTLAKKS